MILSTSLTSSPTFAGQGAPRRSAGDAFVLPAEDVAGDEATTLIPDGGGERQPDAASGNAVPPDPTAIDPWVMIAPMPRAGVPVAAATRRVATNLPAAGTTPNNLPPTIDTDAASPATPSDERVVPDVPLPGTDATSVVLVPTPRSDAVVPPPPAPPAVAVDAERMAAGAETATVIRRAAPRSRLAPPLPATPQIAVNADDAGKTSDRPIGRDRDSPVPDVSLPTTMAAPAILPPVANTSASVAGTGTRAAVIVPSPRTDAPEFGGSPPTATTHNTPASLPPRMPVPATRSPAAPDIAGGRTDAPAIVLEETLAGRADPSPSVTSVTVPAPLATVGRTAPPASPHRTEIADVATLVADPTSAISRRADAGTVGTLPSSARAAFPIVGPDARPASTAAQLLPLSRTASPAALPVGWRLSAAPAPSPASAPAPLATTPLPIAAAPADVPGAVAPLPMATPAMAAATATPFAAPPVALPIVEAPAAASDSVRNVASPTGGDRAAVPVEAARTPAAPVPPLLAAGASAIVFGAARFAAQAGERADDPRGPADAGTVAGLAAHAASTASATAAPAAAPPLDVRHERWPTAMIERIEMIRDAVAERADAADTRIRLIPDALGPIDVAVRRDGDTLHVRFTAEQPQTRALLQDAAPRLAEAAEQRGLRLGQASVGAEPSGQQSSQQHARQQPAPAAPRAPSPVAAAARADADDPRLA